MIRRRLRLSYSSDEEETVTHPPLTQSRPNPYPSEPLPISSSSSDEFIDVSDNLSPPSPQFPESDNPPAPPPSSGGCPVSDFLQGLGLRLKREWLDACVLGLQQSVPGFRNLDAAAKAKLCFEQFLVSDMNLSGGGVLPQNVVSLHLVDLPGPYVLQVDEIVNISNPLKIRYQKASAGHKRCLKLSMTDGVQRVFGMEYRPIQALEALAPAGLKVVVCNAHIRHGLLMLVPQSIEVLGGLVEELDAARKRLVDEVNKPPRGNRTRNGVVPPLVNRAALAAWPPDGVHVAGQANSSTFEAPTPLHASNRDAGRNSIPMTTQETVPLGREHAVYHPSSNIDEEMPMDSIPNSRENAVPNPSSYGFGVERLHINTVPYRRENPVPNTAIPNPPNPPFEDALDIEEDIDMDAVSISSETRGARPSLNDDIHLVNEDETRVPYSSSDAIFSDEDTNVVNEVEHPLLLFGEREPPFIYLSSLSIRLETSNVQSVRGKVKCFLTGVKAFQYKQKYDLRAYIDDGGMISEILIDHNVVQKRIGHSPEDVTAGLSSPDKAVVSKMKENMKQFQVFLANFEGIMLIEISKGSHPVALEMDQGCPSSDAWLLLRRLKGSPPAQTSQSRSSRLAQRSQSLSSRPIDISP